MSSNKKLALPTVKFPTSPTAIVLTVTLLAIVALAGWTGYSYFLMPAASEVSEIAPKKYYTDDLKEIYAEIETFRTYQIEVQEYETGKDDPFRF